MNLKSVAVVVFQSKDLTGGERRGADREEERRGSARKRERERERRLFFFSIDSSPDSHWLLLNKGPREEVG